MARLAAGYDLGLSAEPGHSLNNHLALGNKLFTYLLAGLPILASDGPAHRQFAPGVAGAIGLFAVDDAVSLARAIDSFLSSAEGLKIARETAFRLGQGRFNWDIEKQVLVGCVERALDAGAGEP
jgi:glycosyltransferase involved in cell wall biosynthesis